jgi:hypothetical protein
MPKIHEKPIVRLEADEVVKLLESVEDGSNLTEREKAYHKHTNLRDVAIMTLLLGTVIRVSECVGLNYEDVDFEVDGIRITRKGGNQEIVYFGDEVRIALLNYIRERLGQISIKVEPALFTTQITDCKYELVASSRRVDEGESPHESYCSQLEMAFSEAARVIKFDGVFSFVYSHSSVNGWESVVRAYRKSPFIITSVQPLSIERKGRPRAVMSQAVNTCMTFVARKSKEPKTPIHISDLLQLTEEYAKSFGLPLMTESGWVEADAGLATLACSIGKIAASSEVLGSENDFTAILECSKIVKKHFPEFTIKVRDSI